MQTISQRQIMPAVNLTCVTTDKFKTGLITVNLITQLSRLTASKNALLPRVLRRGTATHPDMDSVSCLLDELYGATIEPIVRKKGELHCIGLCADFIDDDFVPSGSNILEHICDLLGEMLLSPVTHGGLLLSKYVEIEKKNLIDDIRASINNKRTYATMRLVEEMCTEEAYGTDKLGTEQDVSNINARSLTKHYKEVIESSRIEIFYCGNADIDHITEALKSALAALPRNNAPSQCYTRIIFEPKFEKPKIVTDVLNINQGKMCVGFRLGNTMKSPSYPAMLVFNAIYGGAVTSKLFLNVREKLSLCYYAGSVIEKHKGIMLVSSGVEPKNFEKALDELLNQLDAVRKGDITDWEFFSAKRYVISAIRSSLDSLLGLENQLFDFSILGVEFSPEEFAALCDGVTREEIISIAQSIKLDTIYYLKNTEDELR